MSKIWLRIATLLVIAALLIPTFAQEEPPMAEIVNDEGGPVVVLGEMAYTNLFITSGVAQPLVLLEDQAGFVNRDKRFLFPRESQVLGSFTSDFFTSPVGYSISLPIEPQATLVDVDNDDERDTGVMIYTPAYWDNVYGDIFLEKRDMSGGGWSGAYAGTRVSSLDSELTGGWYIIYAPEDGQGFPSGFGDDGMLFTEDDPIVTVPQGYTIVQMDAEPFTFDRSRVAEIPLIEPPTAVANDFTEMGWVEAYDETIQLLRTEYAFTEYKGVDWDAIDAEIRPRVVAAAEAEDDFEYTLALRDLAWSVPDGHVGLFGQGSAQVSQLFIAATEGGLGMTLDELDDGRIIVGYVVEGGPADIARIQPGDEVLALNGTPIREALEEVTVYAMPMSTEHSLRIQQLRYATRAPMGTVMSVTYRNNASGELNTVDMEVAAERESWSRSSILAGAPENESTVEFELLSNGYVYAQISSFQDTQLLMIQSWEDMLRFLDANDIPGLIIEMRFNGGGNGYLSRQMAGYFYEEETIIGYRSGYEPELDEFQIREDLPDTIYPGPENLRYDGEIAVLVGPACSSACEFFSYAMSQLDNVAIVGEYPTNGLGGSVDDILLPNDLRFRFTATRGLDANFEIHIEGIGVVPDVRVPQTEETVFSDDDVVLNAAVEYLDGALTIPFTDGAPLAVGESAEGTLVAGERTRHAITGPADAVNIELTLQDEDVADQIVLRVYDTEGESLGALQGTLVEGLPLLAGVAGETLIIEVGSADEDVTVGYTIEVLVP